MSDSQRRPTIPAVARAAVWDASGGRCFYCAVPINPFLDFHVDHRVPLARGGKNDESNFVGSCSRCNLIKGSHVVFNPLTLVGSGKKAGSYMATRFPYLLTCRHRRGVRAASFFIDRLIDEWSRNPSLPVNCSIFDFVRHEVAWDSRESLAPRNDWRPERCCESLHDYIWMVEDLSELHADDEYWAHNNPMRAKVRVPA